VYSFLDHFSAKLESYHGSKMHVAKLTFTEKKQSDTVPCSSELDPTNTENRTISKNNGKWKLREE